MKCVWRYWAGVANVTGVTMSQASDRLVTITYTLSDAPAVITLDVQTNVTGDVWASIGGEAVWNAMGDVWKKVGDGLTAGNSTGGTITWHPDHSWPDHKIEGNNTRAVVTAWATRARGCGTRRSGTLAASEGGKRQECPSRASRNAGTSERQNAERKRAKTPNENAPKRRMVAKLTKR